MSDIREFVMKEPLFNSHEHQSEWGFDWQKLDYKTFFGYLPADMLASQLPYEENPDKGFFNVWDRICTTSPHTKHCFSGFASQVE